MVQFKILTYNNGVGIVTDAILLKDLIQTNVSKNVDIIFIGEDNIEISDVGTWIQNFNIEHLNKFKKNIFSPPPKFLVDCIIDSKKIRSGSCIIPKRRFHHKRFRISDKDERCINALREITIAATNNTI